MDDLDQLVDQYNQSLSSVLDKYAPFTDRSMKNKFKQPWNWMEKSLRSATLGSLKGHK